MDNDLAKYVDEMYKGAEALIQAFDKYAKAQKGEVKTEQDLAMHANMLGVAGYICMDLMQELQRTREYSKTVSINAINDRFRIASIVNQKIFDTIAFCNIFDFKHRIRSVVLFINWKVITIFNILICIPVIYRKITKIFIIFES